PPIEFRRRTSDGVHLHFVNVPSRGFVEILVFSKSLGVRTERKACAGRAFDHDVQLRTDEHVQIKCGLVEESTRQAGLVIMPVIDPTRDRDVTVDLAGTARVLSLEAPGVELRGDAWIVMFRVEAGL